MEPTRSTVGVPRLRLPRQHASHPENPPARAGLICEPEPGVVRRVHGEGATAFEITFSQQSGAVVMAAAGEVDPATSPWLREQLLYLLLDPPASLVLALEQVPFMDASGLSTLAVVDRCAQQVGTHFMVAGPTRQVQKLLAITGMDKTLAIFPTLADALTDIPARRGRPARTFGSV